jgi:acyl-CoA dehydrogenase
VDFQNSSRSVALQSRLRAFVDDQVIPHEGVYERELAALESPHGQPAIMEELKAKARVEGLWNLCVGEEPWGPGLTPTEFAPLVEIAGRSLIGLETVNSAAPDTGNMELLALFGSPEQQERWLRPLADGVIRSCFAMSEPGVPSSDPTQLAATVEQRGERLVLHGTKWFASGATDDRCELLLFVGRSNEGPDPRRRHSVVLVPRDTPGVTIVRDLSVFGYHDKFGHAEIRFDEVVVPRSALLGEEGNGFAQAQARLGPGRIHYGMRVIGMAERSLELLCRRALDRAPFGTLLADQSSVHEWIGRSRAGIDQARLLVLHTAAEIERVGAKAARTSISMVKFAALQSCFDVIDRAIQVHGAAGVSDDLPLARMYALCRALRIADGPDEVHLRSVARAELAKYREPAEPSGERRTVREPSLAT